MSIPVVHLCSNCDHVWSATAGDTLTSPFPTLLQSNEAPSAFDARQFRNMVLEAESDISRLDIEIDRLQDVLNKLTRNRDVLRRHVRDHQTVFSPIRRVPPEIWSEIFLYCDPRRYPVTKHAPLSLTGVSRQWREIAISIPLWFDICVDYTIKKAESQANWVKLWLSRSGTHPLIIDFYCESHKLPNPVLDALIMYSPQWRDATFDIPEHFVPALTPITSRIQQLQVLDISKQSFPINVVTLDAFEIAPSLRKVHLCGLDWNALSLPWAQLTHLYIVLNLVEQAVQILRHSPNLEDCSFLQTYGEPSPPPLQHIQHTRLRHLHVELDDLFESITLPNLRRLSVSGMQWPTLGFPLFLTRSSCTIESLTLNGICGRLHALIQSLHQIPSINTLRFNGQHRFLMITDEFLSHLTYRPEEPFPCLLPNLHEVYFAIPEMVSSERLVEMIQSRRRRVDINADGVVARLRVVHLSVEHAIESETLKLLRSLRDDDLSIKVFLNDGLLKQLL